MKFKSAVHPEFKLNGQSYDKESLCLYAKQISDSSEEYLRHISSFLLEWFNDVDFVEVTTSGTTGNPKKIQIKKEAMLASAQASISFFELPPGCKALHCLPVQYIAGKMMLIRALVGGWELDLVKPDAHPLDGNTKKYDFTAMVPLQVENSLQDLDRVKKIIIGGAKLDKTLSDKLKPLQTAMYETYGMTETITHIAAKKVQEDHFTVLPGIFITVDDRSCLAIDAPRLSEEKIVTNDIVALISPNQFKWLGRFDNVINSGGIKLFPEKIEEKLYGKIQRRFFVFGKPDVSLGEKVILVIEGDAYALEQSIFDSLDKYEKPKEIVFVKKFAETETGKIKRAASI